MYFNTQGIILRKRPFRQSDSFFSFYTLEAGKVEALGRAVRASRSKLGGHLDYFSVIDLMIARGRKFNHIGGAVIEENFSFLKQDFRKISLGFYGLEITDYFIKEGKTDKRIFYLLVDWLKFLDKGADYRHSLLATYLYILKLLSLLGYRPNLQECLKCRQSIQGVAYFDFLSGGALCGKCGAEKNGRIMAVKQEVVWSLDNLLRGDLLSLERIKFNREFLKEALKLIDGFLLFRIDKELKSRVFILK